LRDYGSTPQIWDGDPKCEHEWGDKIPPHGEKSGKHGTNSTIGAKIGQNMIRRGEGSNFCIHCGAWKGELGLEPTFDLYIKHLCDIFDEIKRVLKKTGTCWVNLGDTYSGGNLCVGQPENWESISTTNKEKYNSKEFNDFIRQRNKLNPIESKSLCQIPSRFAIEMTRRRGYVVKTEKDEAWLGGLIEGEGCITIAEHKGYYEPRVQVAMVNKNVLEKIRYITGVGTVTKQTSRNNPKWNDSYIWKCGGSTASKLCADIFEYLISKREQARILWRVYKMQNERPRSGGDPYSKRGLKYTEKQKEELKKWFEQVKAHNQGNGNPTNLNNPEKNEPWILRNTIIWYKPNCMPSPAKDRFTVDFEKIFFFTKSKKYYFEQQLEKGIIPAGTLGAKGSKERYGLGVNARPPEYKEYTGQRNKRCVWEICPQPFPDAHFAVFPEKLVETPIKAGCPKNGIVLDPFAGSGTTCIVAKKLGRDFIGIDIQPKYVEMANKRLNKVPVRLDSFKQLEADKQ
jgi:DNA modification methylase